MSGTDAYLEAMAKVVEEAKTQLGVKYVYGGEDPGVGFDCSGLTQWCYSKAGLTIPRTSQEQFASMVKIPRKSVVAGDLVFFVGSDPPSPGHVGIVISLEKGSVDKMIDAPFTGAVVRYDDFGNHGDDTAYGFVGFGRIHVPLSNADFPQGG